MIELPSGVRQLAARGPDWQRWADGLARTADDALHRWGLRTDGPPTHGTAALIVPVRTPEGVPAVVKIGFPDASSEHEHLVLRRWGGHGAVRLLAADPHRRVVLLERLQPSTLVVRSDVQACAVVADIYRRIHVPAIPQLRSLTTDVADWLKIFENLPADAPIPRRLVEHAVTLARELIADPGTARVLHGDLHYRRVLAAEREPWLTIAPKPVNGDPHSELAPMLWQRWDELAGNVRNGVRARFYSLVDAAGFDEHRARAWAVVRVVHEATRELDRGAHADTATLTRYVTLAKAIQD